MVPASPVPVDTWTYTAKFSDLADCGCQIRPGDIVHVTRYANLRFKHCPKCFCKYGIAYRLYGNPKAKTL